MFKAALISTIDKLSSNKVLQLKTPQKTSQFLQPLKSKTQNIFQYIVRKNS